MKWVYIIFAGVLAIFAYWTTLSIGQFLWWNIPNPFASLSIPLFILSGITFLLAFTKVNLGKHLKKQHGFLLPLFIALALDIGDFLLAPIFMVPILGDVVDFLGVIVLSFLVGPVALLGILEIVPVIGDAFPCFTVAVMLSRLFGRRK